MALISDLHLATTMTLSLEAPIEDLKLSTRVRNVLRRSGLDTLGSLLEPNGKPAIRGFGLEARAELARALAASGFALPANLSSSEFNEVAESVSTLRGQIEASFQKWSAQIQDLELHIRRLGASERGRPAVAERSGRQHVSVALTGALADECKTRLTSICTASGCLLATRRLLPEQRELVSVIEEECIRLSGLLDCLLCGCYRRQNTDRAAPVRRMRFSRRWIKPRAVVKQRVGHKIPRLVWTRGVAQ